jgi:acetyl esterase
MALDEATAGLLTGMAESGAKPLHEMTPAEARGFGDMLRELYGPGPQVAAVREERVPVAGGDSIAVRVLVPEGAPDSVIVYYHGGGWVIGALDEFDTMARQLANRTGAVVALVDYRLAPEHRYPTAAEDAWAALTWIEGHLPERAEARLPLVVAGDSAGGNLAAVVALGARDRGGPPVAFQLLVYPVLDATAETASWREHAEGFHLTAAGMRWYWAHYLGQADGAAPDASPLRAAFVGGLPPALVVGAEHDILRDEGEAYATRLAEAGVAATATRYPGVVHGFFRWRAVTPVADTALKEAATALRWALAGP